MTNAVIYARYSSDNQRDESIDAQVRAIHKYAHSKGMLVVDLYTDEAKSATTDDRPGFQKLMRDAEDGRFSIVLVHKLDRFARNRYDSAFYKRHLRRNGVKVCSVLENLDDSPESIILESLLEGMAEYYSKNLAREVMKGLSETAYQCKHTGGMAPLGFDVAPDKTYVINEREAEAVRLIFSMYASGHGYSSILDALNGAGYRTKLGRKFGKNSLHDIMKNEKYSGVFVFNKTERKIDGKRNGHKYKPADEVIRIPDGCPRIVPDETFRAVQNKLTDNARNGGRFSSKVLYLLSGIIYCGNCGGTMYGNRAFNGRNKTEYITYRCTTRKQKRDCKAKPINRDFIETIVIDGLHDTFFSDEIIGSMATLIHEAIEVQFSELPEAIKTRETELRQVENKIYNIVQSIAGGMFHESMKAEMDHLEERKREINDFITKAKIDFSRNHYTRDEVLHYLERFQNLKEFAKVDQRAVIQQFVHRVTVFEEEVVIDFKIDHFVRLKRKKNGTPESSSGDADCTLNGGDEGSRTPVRKPFAISFSERSYCFRSRLAWLPVTTSRFDQPQSYNAGSRQPPATFPAR